MGISPTALGLIYSTTTNQVSAFEVEEVTELPDTVRGAGGFGSTALGDSGEFWLSIFLTETPNVSNRAVFFAKKIQML